MEIIDKLRKFFPNSNIKFEGKAPEDACWYASNSAGSLYRKRETCEGFMFDGEKLSPVGKLSKVAKVPQADHHMIHWEDGYKREQLPEGIFVVHYKGKNVVEHGFDVQVYEWDDVLVYEI